VQPRPQETGHLSGLFRQQGDGPLSTRLDTSTARDSRRSSSVLLDARRCPGRLHRAGGAALHARRAAFELAAAPRVRSRTRSRRAHTWRDQDAPEHDGAAVDACALSRVHTAAPIVDGRTSRSRSHAAPGRRRRRRRLELRHGRLASRRPPLDGALDCGLGIRRVPRDDRPSDSPAQREPLTRRRRG